MRDIFTEINFPGVDGAYPSKLQAGNENLTMKCLKPGEISMNMHNQWNS